MCRRRPQFRRRPSGRSALYRGTHSQSPARFVDIDPRRARAYGLDTYHLMTSPPGETRSRAQAALSTVETDLAWAEALADSRSLRQVAEQATDVSVLQIDVKLRTDSCLLLRSSTALTSCVSHGASVRERGRPSLVITVIFLRRPSPAFDGQTQPPRGRPSPASAASRFQAQPAVQPSRTFFAYGLCASASPIAERVREPDTEHLSAPRSAPVSRITASSSALPTRKRGLRCPAAVLSFSTSQRYARPTIPSSDDDLPSLARVPSSGGEALPHLGRRFRVLLPSVSAPFQLLLPSKWMASGYVR